MIPSRYAPVGRGTVAPTTGEILQLSKHFREERVNTLKPKYHKTLSQGLRVQYMPRRLRPYWTRPDLLVS